MATISSIRTGLTVATAVALLGVTLTAQEKKVPKDSVRVTIPGCTRGYMFTAGPRTEDQVGRSSIPEGMHIRMTGPKKLINEIKIHEGQMVAITGLMKKGQPGQGISLGGGVRVSAGAPVAGSGGPPSYMLDSPAYIDVESWQPAAGNCP